MKRVSAIFLILLLAEIGFSQTNGTLLLFEDTIFAPVTRQINDWYGSPCISGNRLMVGAMYSIPACTTGSGAGYVNYYEKDSLGDWVFFQRIESPEPSDCDHFGSDMAIDGDCAFIGAWRDDNNGFTDVGKVYRFQKLGGTWTHTPPDLYCPSPSNNDQFGVSVEINDGFAFIGALGDNQGNGPGSGTVFYYTISSPGILTYQNYIVARSRKGMMQMTISAQILVMMIIPLLFHLTLTIMVALPTCLKSNYQLGFLFKKLPGQIRKLVMAGARAWILIMVLSYLAHFWMTTIQ